MYISVNYRLVSTLFPCVCCILATHFFTHTNLLIKMGKYRAGVLFGDELSALYQDAKTNKFALPAVNVINTNTINAVLETAAKVKSPVIIQFSNGGAQFVAGKGMPNDNLQAIISGAISGALHVHNVAR